MAPSVAGCGGEDERSLRFPRSLSSAKAGVWAAESDRSACWALTTGAHSWLQAGGGEDGSTAAAVGSASGWDWPPLRHSGWPYFSPVRWRLDSDRLNGASSGIWTRSRPSQWASTVQYV
eukprot:2410404-Prymnesium_polylepis.3